MEMVVFWYRRDLRIEDNVGLFNALSSNHPVLPLFIFDDNILSSLKEDDARISFIYENLLHIDEACKKNGSSLLVLKGNPIDVWKDLVLKYKIKAVYYNKDYEPYAIDRDTKISSFLKEHKIDFRGYKDQVIFEENEILKDDGTPYSIYTPYKKKWLNAFKKEDYKPLNYSLKNLYTHQQDLPSLKDIGFKNSEIKVKDFKLSELANYANDRDFPAKDNTSYLSPHLRFGTVSIRQVITNLKKEDDVFLSELIWREFFMQILYHYPKVVTNNFKPKYDGIKWRNNKDEFKRWCEGKTGYPMVDAGMRQLNQTGYIHNRVRMVVASFLCKHLLINWQWGEAYFAEKLLDFELSSNNGNWQWAAGTGCDAAPYFRVFNPTEQMKKFDKNAQYVLKWVPEFGSANYTQPMVEHSFARKRAIDSYKAGLL